MSIDNLIIIIVVSVVIGALLVLFLIGQTSHSKNYKKYKEKLLDDLKSIHERLNKQELEPAFALLQGDIVVDKILKIRIGQSGSYSDRLKKAKNLYTKELYNNIWEYHKIRNKIAHENLAVDSETAKKALKVFENAIESL